MPPRGNKLDRLSEVERELDDARRRLARLEARPANPSGQRAGRLLATIDAQLSAGGTVAVTGKWWDGSAVAGNSIAVTARDYFLPTGQTAPSGTKVIVEFMDDAEWWITGFAAGSGEPASILFGLVNEGSDVASTDATFAVDNVVVLSPVGGISPGASIASVNNILMFPSANNDEVLIFRKGETSTYYAIPHPSRTDCS